MGKIRTGGLAIGESTPNLYFKNEIKIKMGGALTQSPKAREGYTYLYFLQYNFL
jgi:hypothetical protein